jgi:hypothetical protein
LWKWRSDGEGDARGGGREEEEEGRLGERMRRKRGRETRSQRIKEDDSELRFVEHSCIAVGEGAGYREVNL